MSIFKSISLAICLIFFLQAISARRSFSKHLNLKGSGKQYTFNGQLIDHYNPQDGRTFSQRYWVANEFFNPGPNSPIFLYLCGESTCTGAPSNTSFPYQMAQRIGALLIGIEHRYYGLSVPFGPQSFKTENLRYLTVEQALGDIAYFILWFKENYTFKIYDSQPWITIGGSYVGGLSAWFRNRYPHLTAGAWASSATLEASVDYSDYNYHVYLDLSRSGPACPQTIEKLTKYFEYQLYETSPDAQQAFKARFGQDALKLTNEELLYFIADSIAYKCQYGQRIEICNFVTNYSDFDQLVNNTIQYFLGYNDVRAYGAYFIRNDTFDPEMVDRTERLWIYQTCSQIGWFQTASKKSPYLITSSRINIDFFKTFCKNAFGVDLWPDIERFNIDFGGVELRTTNLILVNGVEDPCQVGTKNTTTGSMTAIYVSCDTCAHCVDLYGDNSTVPRQKAHNQIQSLLLNYIGKSESELISY